MKKNILILFIVILSQAGFSQLIPEGIIHAFEKGDAKELSIYLNSNVELKVLEEVHITSKNQAVRILQDFFKSHPTKSFLVAYEESKKDSRYGLGTLETKKGTFKVNLYFMENGKERLIYYLSLEKSE